MNETIKRKPSAAAMRAADEIDNGLWGGEALTMADMANVIDKEFAPLVAAAKLAVENFERCDISGNDLGEDDYEAWQALSDALAALDGV